MTSNRTVEAFDRIWAEHNAGLEQDRASTLQPSATFTFNGKVPEIKRPQLVFFGQHANLLPNHRIASATHFEPPRAPPPRPWDYDLFGSVEPRFRGRDLYKRSGVLARSPRDSTQHIKAQYELLKFQTGPRKRSRPAFYFHSHADSDASTLWNLEAINASARQDDLETARTSVYQHYIDLHHHNLPVPLLIEHHTWHGSINIEDMTIIPRKRLHNNEPVLRYEELEFESQIAMNNGAEKTEPSKTHRFIRTCRRAPRLSTVDECTEPSSSPRHIAHDEVVPARSPYTMVASRLSASAGRASISPWRFTFMKQSQVGHDGDETPSKPLRASHPSRGERSPRGAASQSPIRLHASMLCAPDHYLSPSVSNQPASANDVSSPCIAQLFCSPDSRHLSTPTKKQRGRRRSSLTAARLLALSEMSQSPASARTPLASSETALTKASFVDDIKDDISILEATTTPSKTCHVDTATDMAEAESTPRIHIYAPEETTTADERNSATGDLLSRQDGLFDTSNDVAAQRKAAPGSIPKEAGPSTPVPTTPVKADAVMPESNDVALVNVDLRQNLDIFGCSREAEVKAQIMSSPTMSPVTKVNESGENIQHQDSPTNPDNEPDNEVVDEDDMEEDEMTSVIDHDKINDTISLKFSGSNTASPQQANELAPGQGILSPSCTQEESEDENREHLQSFLDRIKAGKTARAAKQALKVKRRSGSLGTLASGSPMQRSDSNSSDDGRSSKRKPLGERSPNLSPSPTKKRKSLEDEVGSGLLQAPCLEDHSPPKPKRRRKNAEAESEGILSSDFQVTAVGETRTDGGEQPPPRRSTRMRRNLLPSAPSANGIALSKLPMKARGAGLDDGGFGGSPSIARIRNDDRSLQATTRANTRRNKGGAMHASDMLSLEGKRKLGESMDECKPTAVKEKSKATKSLDSAKIVRWSSPLASYQEPPRAVVEAEAESADELSEEKSAATTAAATAVSKRRTNASRLPPPTPIKKTTTTGIVGGGTAGGRVKKAAHSSGPLVASRRVSAQLAAASAAKEEAVHAAAAEADKKMQTRTSTRSRIGLPTISVGTATTAAGRKRRVARAA